MYTLTLKVVDAGGSSSTGTVNIIIHDKNDPPIFVIPNIATENNENGNRCNELLQISDICLSARENSRYGQNTGASVAAFDEDIEDLLVFAVLFQKSRALGSNAVWENPSEDENGNSEIFSIKQFGRVIQFYVEANEGHSLTLKDLGDFEYLLSLSVTDGRNITTVLVTIILQDTNFPPTFLDCDIPRSILEYNNADDPQGIHTFSNNGDVIRVKDSLQHASGNFQNIRLSSLNNNIFVFSNPWPKFITCEECDSRDDGLTFTGRATCCNSNLLSIAPTITYKRSHEQTYTVTIISEDDGPGSEINRCTLNIYVANRNNPPSILTIDYDQWETKEIDKGFHTIGHIQVIDPDEIDGTNELSLRIKQYFIGHEDVNSNILGDMFDIVKSRDNNILPKATEKISIEQTLESLSASELSSFRSIGYILRLLRPLNFEAFENKHVTILIECINKFELKDTTTIVFDILDINDSPYPTKSSASYYKINENAYHGDVVIGNLNDIFEDEDSQEIHTFHLYRAGNIQDDRPILASSCWSFNLDNRPHAVIPVTPDFNFRDANLFVLFFNLQSSGPIDIYLMSEIKTSPGKIYQSGKEKLAYSIQYGINIGGGEYSTEVELRRMKTEYYSMQAKPTLTNDQENVLLTAVTPNKESLINEHNKKPFWLKVELPLHASFGASSTAENVGGTSGEFNANAAFDRKLDTFYLSDCKHSANYTWLQINLHSAIKIYGMKILSSSIHFFPYKYCLEGKFNESAASWEHILFVEEENISEVNACTNQYDAPCSGMTHRLDRNPKAFSHYRIKIYEAGIPTHKLGSNSIFCDRVQINEIVFFAGENSDALIQFGGGSNHGTITFGTGETLNKNTIFRYAVTCQS